MAPDDVEASPGPLAESASLELRRRARLGMLVLGARSVVQQLVVLVGTIVLLRLLEPADYGAFAIVQFALSLFRVLGDVGLGPSLVQKARAPDERELSTVFWAQLGLTGLVVGGVLALAEVIVRLWPDMPPDAPLLLRVLSVSLLLTMLRVIPSILLERELRFVPLSFVDLTGTCAFQITAITLAALGHGTGALVGAVLVQGLVLLVAIHVARPWRPRLVFDREVVTEVMRFGLPFQGKTIVSLLNGAVTPALAGTLLGRTGLGLNNFAQGTAWFPLQLVMIIGRVSFPLFARLADDRRALAEELRFSLRLCGTVAVGFAALFFALGPQIIGTLYHPKWLPALPALYVYSAALVLGYISPIVAAVFDGIGRPGVIFRLSIGWTLVNWLMVSIGMAVDPGLLVFAVAYCVHVVVGNLAVIVLLRREVPDLSMTRLLGPLVGVAVVVALGGRALLAPIAGTPLGLLFAATAVVAAFLGLAVGVDAELRAAVHRFVAGVRSRRRAKAARA